MEITKREVIASISILAILLIIGTLISGKISDAISDNNAIYNKAVKITDKELFSHAMNTNTGNAFVEGELIALDPVTYPDIRGEYLEIERIEEHYVRKTKTVTYTDSKGKTQTRTETYWEWDEMNRESKVSERVQFLGHEFKSNKFDLPYKDYLTTVKKSGSVRFKYYTSPVKIDKATIFTYLADKGLKSDSKITIYPNQSIQEVHEDLTSDFPLVLFWIIWIPLSLFIIYYFYEADNDWLNY